MHFGDEGTDWQLVAPPRRSTFLQRHPAAWLAMVFVVAAIVAAIVRLGLLYASELEPSLRTDDETFEAAVTPPAPSSSPRSSGPRLSRARPRRDAPRHGPQEDAAPAA